MDPFNQKQNFSGKCSLLFHWFFFFILFFSFWNLHWINIELLNLLCILNLLFSAASFFFNIPAHWFVLQLCSFFNLTKLFNFLCCYFKFPSLLFMVPSPLLKKWIPYCLKKLVPPLSLVPQALIFGCWLEFFAFIVLFSSH